MNSNERLNHDLKVDSDRMTTFVRVHTRLKLVQMLHLERLAYSKGITRAEAIRDAVDLWLNFFDAADKAFDKGDLILMSSGHMAVVKNVAGMDPKMTSHCPNACGATEFTYQIPMRGCLMVKQFSVYRCGTWIDDAGNVWTSDQCRARTENKIAKERGV